MLSYLLLNSHTPISGKPNLPTYITVKWAPHTGHVLKFFMRWYIGQSVYCNSIPCGLPNTELIKLQRVQNAAARLVTSTSRYHHITPILYELHWLPVKYLQITFKVIYGMAPECIKDLLNIKKEGNYS